MTVKQSLHHKFWVRIVNQVFLHSNNMARKILQKLNFKDLGSVLHHLIWLEDQELGHNQSQGWEQYSRNELRTLTVQTRIDLDLVNRLMFGLLSTLFTWYQSLESWDKCLRGQSQLECFSKSLFLFKCNQLWLETTFRASRYKSLYCLRCLLSEN